MIESIATDAVVGLVTLIALGLITFFLSRLENGDESRDDSKNKKSSRAE